MVWLVERARVDPGNWFAVGRDLTNDRGEFRFEDIAPGEYQLQATEDRYALVRSSEFATSTRNVRVGADRTVVHIGVEPGVELRVRVRDNVVGEGLDEVRLTLHDAEGVRLRGWWRTSATGEAFLRVRPNRRYRLTASRPGYRTVERTVDIGESDDTIELTLALDDE